MHCSKSGGGCLCFEVIHGSHIIAGNDVLFFNRTVLFVHVQNQKSGEIEYNCRDRQMEFHVDDF
jgi:hypothetical protein